MKKFALFQYLDLPTLPDEFHYLALDVASGLRTKRLSSVRSPVITLPDGTVSSGTVTHRYELPIIIQEWVTEHIKPKHMSVFPSVIKAYESPVAAPRFATPAWVEGGRGTRSLEFAMIVGGESSEVTWYSEKAKPLYRNPTDVVESVAALDNMQQLITMHPNRWQWIAFEGSVLRSISNIHSRYITLSIGIDDNEVEDFCKLHNIEMDNSIWEMSKS